MKPNTFIVMLIPICCLWLMALIGLLRPEAV
jgi:hypothetical protein